LGALWVGLCGKNGGVAGHPIGKNAGGGLSRPLQQYGLDRFAIDGESQRFTEVDVLGF